jgi:hypothetical protein
MTPQEKAKAGVEHLKEAILDYLLQKPSGVRHSEIVQDLGLESDYEGSQKNYLSWSVLGLLLAEGRVRYERDGRSKIYFKT